MDLCDRVGRLSLGCGTFGREVGEEGSFEILDYAVERGLTLLDTAEAYGGGNARAYRAKTLGVEDVREVSGEMHSSELILGRWLKARRGLREDVVVQTKTLPPLSGEKVGAAIEASLRRLGREVIDIYMFHAPPAAAEWGTMEEGLRAVERAVTAGKVREFGISNFSWEQVRELMKWGLRVGWVQNNYNLAVRDIEKEMLPRCVGEGVGVQTYSPLGAGFLTGKYAPPAGGGEAELPEGSRFHVIPGHKGVYFHPEKFEVVRRLKALSERVGIPVAKLALSWVVKNPGVKTVLVGARHVGQVASAVEALEVKWEAAWEDEVLGENRV